MVLCNDTAIIEHDGRILGLSNVPVAWNKTIIEQRYYPSKHDTTHFNLFTYTFSSNFLIPSAKLPGLMRTFSKESATRKAMEGAKWMSATRGMSYLC